MEVSGGNLALIALTIGSGLSVGKAVMAGLPLRPGQNERQARNPCARKLSALGRPAHQCLNVPDGLSPRRVDTHDISTVRSERNKTSFPRYNLC
jgi:hypothetical protein